MSERRDYYDDMGNHIGYSQPSCGGGGDFDLWMSLIILGIIAIVIGVIFGVGSMLGFVFWIALISGVGGLIIFLVAMGITKLNSFLDDKTDGHASVVWVVISIILVIMGVSACHSWLFGG